MLQSSEISNGKSTDKDLASIYMLHHLDVCMWNCPSILEQRFQGLEIRDGPGLVFQVGSEKQVSGVVDRGQKRIVDMGVNKIIRLLCIIKDMGLNTKVGEQGLELE